MKYIDELLKGHEVVWKPLGEVCEIKGRIGFRGYTRNDLVEQGEGAITLSPSNIINQQLSFENCSYISWAKYEESPEIKVEPYDVIFTKTASVGKTALVKTLPHEATINPQLVLLKRIKCKPAYLAYILQNDSFQQSVKQLTGQGSVPNVSQSALAKILIPLPPLSVQEEIVRILDKFTTLEAELEAELDCRKRQYEYYRNQLLSFDMLNRGGQRLNNVILIPLGNIGEVCMCKRILKQQTSEKGDVPFYKIGTFGKVPNSFISKELFYKYKEKYNYPVTGEVLISASGTIGRAVIYDGKEAYFQDSNIVWIKNDESQVLNKYLYYYYQIAKWNVAEGGTIQRLYNDNLRKTLIPIPYPSDRQKSLAEQHRIVSILDKFDTLTTSISEGLPKEIEFRRKQYEYYREQLLSFRH